MYLPSGESWAPEISGSPKSSSRSMIGGGVTGGELGICDPNLADFGVSSERHVRFFDGRAALRGW